MQARCCVWPTRWRRVGNTLKRSKLSQVHHRRRLLLGASCFSRQSPRRLSSTSLSPFRFLPTHRPHSRQAIAVITPASHLLNRLHTPPPLAVPRQLPQPCSLLVPNMVTITTNPFSASLLTCLSRSRHQVRHLSLLHLQAEFSFHYSTFSPEGRLFQVEYSLEAIKLGSTAIGVCPIATCSITYSLSDQQTGRNLGRCHSWCREARHFNTARD